MASLTTHSTPAGAALSAMQTTIMAVFGAVLWFAAALLMRVIEPLGALQSMGVAVSYALTVPGTIPFVYVARWLARLRGDQTAAAITVATATALLLDGTAFAAVPALYGANSTGAAAAILWGAGVALVLGMLMNKAERA